MFWRVDKGLLLAIFFFVGLGLVQVYSSSYVLAIERYGDELYFFKKQIGFAVMGICGLLAVVYMPWRWWRSGGVLLFFFALVGICMTFFPGVSVKVGGAQRWIHLPMGFRFEPAELLKISYPFMLSFFLSGFDKKTSKVALTACLIGLLLPLFLLLKQPDFGSAIICSLVIFSTLFVFGLPWKHVVFCLLALIVGGSVLVVNSSYRMARMMAYVDPWQDPGEKGFQIIQSLLSFQSGGLLGVGLGLGQGKLFFLPEAHTDFTMAVLGEELGFFGLAFVIGLYGYIIFKGFQITVRSDKKMDKSIALGITMVFAMSVFINVGMSLGLLPTKGLALPFLSYGGSSLVCTCVGLGWLLAIDRNYWIKSRLKSFFGYQL